MGLATVAARQIENNRAEGLPASRRHDPRLASGCASASRERRCGPSMHALEGNHHPEVAASFAARQLISQFASPARPV